jgi:cytochrome c biogenesis factor
MAGFDLKNDTAIIGAFVNPMVAWLWLGGVFILIGGITAILPMRRT